MKPKAINPPMAPMNMISIGTFALLKDLNVFEGLRDSYHKALEVIK